MSGLFQKLTNFKFMKMTENDELKDMTEKVLEYMRKNAPEMLDLIASGEVFDSRAGGAEECAGRWKYLFLERCHWIHICARQRKKWLVLRPETAVRKFLHLMESTEVWSAYLVSRKERICCRMFFCNSLNLSTSEESLFLASRGHFLVSHFSHKHFLASQRRWLHYTHYGFIKRCKQSFNAVGVFYYNANSSLYIYRKSGEFL